MSWFVIKQTDEIDVVYIYIHLCQKRETKNCKHGVEPEKWRNRNDSKTNGAAFPVMISY